MFSLITQFEWILCCLPTQHNITEEGGEFSHWGITTTTLYDAFKKWGGRCAVERERAKEGECVRECECERGRKKDSYKEV